MSKVVIAGGTGFIGRALINELGRGDDPYDLCVLSRDGRPIEGARVIEWDAETVGPWKEELEVARAVLNLAGEPIAQHWNDQVKERIVSSRVLSTRAIGQAIAQCQKPPDVWINASAIGYYGDRGGEELTEHSPPGKKGDFLVDTCVAWEHEIDSAQTPATRKVRMRTGLALGRGGGAFEPLYKVTKWFLGGHLGNGSQIASWIHIKDLARLYRHAIENPAEGALNATAPTPVTHRFLMATLRAVMDRPWAPPVPGFILKLFETLGGPPASLLLEGQRVLPAKALAGGFQFEQPDLKDALQDLVHRNKQGRKGV